MKSTAAGTYSPFRSLLSFLLEIFAVILFILFVHHFIGVKGIVAGESMYPTLNDRECLFVNKIVYEVGEPDRYDVIVFHPKVSPESCFIKRVYGLPGETIQIKDGEVYVNGETVPDIYGYGDTDYSGIAGNEITLKKGEYFVLGDNRQVSEDSRYEEVGPVTKESIMGRVTWKIWPLPFKKTS